MSYAASLIEMVSRLSLFLPKDIANMIEDASVSHDSTFAAGLRHSVAVRSDGSLVSWGNDDDGQVSNTPTGALFFMATAGANFSVALKIDGSLVSWGIDNENP